MIINNKLRHGCLSWSLSKFKLFLYRTILYYLIVCLVKILFDEVSFYWLECSQLKCIVKHHWFTNTYKRTCLKTHIHVIQYMQTLIHVLLTAPVKQVISYFIHLNVVMYWEFDFNKYLVVNANTCTNKHNTFSRMF